MENKTALQQMLDELMAHEYTIPLELIVKCKELIELEKEQMKRLFEKHYDETGYISMTLEDAERYYNETYKP
jgi:hypothetical protein